MALGVVREGLEPSLFYDARLSADGRTLSATGWFLDPKLESAFELELYDVSPEPKLEGRFICVLPTGARELRPWQDQLTLEVNRAL